MATGDLCQLADVKLYLNVTSAADDTLLARMITAQSRYFETETSRVFSAATYTEVFDGNTDRVKSKASINFWSPSVQGIGLRGFAVNLRNYPVTSVTTVMIDGVVVPARPALTSGDPNNALNTDGWVLIDGTRVEIQGGNYSFTPGIGNVSITYVAGFSAVPKDVEDAVIMLVAWRYRERDRLGQVSKIVGGESVSYSRESIPPYAQSIIELYRTVHV